MTSTKKSRHCRRRRCRMPGCSCNCKACDKLRILESRNLPNQKPISDDDAKKRVESGPKCCCNLVKAGHGGYCPLH